MLKKITTFALSLLCVFNMMAQSNNDRVATKAGIAPKSITTYPASDIEFWCGTGSSQAIIIVGYDDAVTPIAYAWGIRFNGTPVVTDLFDSIMAYDSRVSYTMSGSLLDAFNFNNGADTPTGYSTWWCYTLNNVWCSTYNTQTVADGNVFVMSTDCTFGLTTADVVPVSDPNPPATATVSVSAPDTSVIDYWCGRGSNKAVVSIGWEEGANQACLAWGVRWNGSTTAKGLLDSIAAHDTRFTWHMTGTMADALAFNDGTTSLTSSSNWWCYKLNGSMAGAYGSQQISNNDVLYLSSACAYSSTTATVMTNPNPTTPDTPDPVAVEADIDSAAILYWIGTGSHYAKFIVNWADTALAWGYRFSSDSVSVLQMMADIRTADPRFSFSGTSYIEDIYFINGNDTISIDEDEDYWMYNVNGFSAADYVNAVYIHSGDMVKYGAGSVATVTDYMEWEGIRYPLSMVWTMPVHPVSVYTAPVVLPVDASIAASDILYWVGTGSNEVRFIVSWAQPDTALAWGYRFDGASVTASTVINDICAADPRLSITDNPSYTGDIYYQADANTSWHLSPVGAAGFNFWYTVHNGTSANSGIGETLVNGDYFKFGDYNAAQCADPEPGVYCMESVWTTPVVAVPVPTTDTTATPTPVEADIDSAAILYWVGTGDHYAKFIVNWPDSALAWGYRFSSDSILVFDMMDDIRTADPRFDFEGTFMLSDLTFIEGTDTLAIDAASDDWMYNVNGHSAPDYADAVYIHSGDMVKFGALSAATITDFMEWEGFIYPLAQVWEQTVYPVNPPANSNEAVEASIAEDDILYWLGQGNKNFTFIVNWADTVLAWGYHSWYDSVTVQEIMDQILVNDSRFSYTAAGSMVSDINFTENGRTYGITPGQYWMYNVNGIGAGLTFDAQYVHNHDMIKWGDPSVAVVTDSMEWGGVWYPLSMVWTMNVTPASVATAQHGPFCGAVGTDGCEAIPANSNAFIGWAATCELSLGYQDIANQGPLVSYGDADDAIGACDTVDNLSVVSLGDGGTATLTFDGHIYNGEGPDFAVFENSFNDSFLELAFVEVSSDGERFVRFPATSLTQTQVQVGGIGTIDPTFINNLAGKYRHGWGTPFDLDDLRDSAGIDINHITHVRIVDVVGSINPEYATYDAFGHIVNDPYPTNSYSSGFDLDGVGAIHLSNGTPEGIDEAMAELKLYPNPASDRVMAAYPGHFVAQVYDLAGRLVLQAEGTDHAVLSTTSLTSGIYMVRINENVQKLVVRH